MTKEQDREIRLSVVEPELHQMLEALSEANLVLLAVKVHSAWLDADEPTLSPYLHPTNEERAEHLARYLVNATKRTGQKWEVVKQYTTPGAGWRGEASYHRALLKAEDGSTVRIYYKPWSKCWVRGQRVLAPKKV